MKLIKYNVIQKSFNETVKNYMEKFNNNIFMTDTTLISNKNGYNPKYNPQLRKHKSYSPEGNGQNIKKLKFFYILPLLY